MTLRHKVSSIGSTHRELSPNFRSKERLLIHSPHCSLIHFPHCSVQAKINVLSLFQEPKNVEIFVFSKFEDTPFHQFPNLATFDGSFFARITLQSEGLLQGDSK